MPFFVVDLYSSFNPKAEKRGYPSWDPRVSGDGQRVVFESEGELVAGDRNGVRDVYLWERGTGQVTRISVSTQGQEGNLESEDARISRDGRYVVFASDATTLVAGDTNQARDVFLRDLQTGTTTRVSVANDGSQGDGASDQPALAGDGSVVAFRSAATNLIGPGQDVNLSPDVYLRVLGPTPRTEGVVIQPTLQPNGDSWFPDLSEDGRYVAFSSRASNLVAGELLGAAYRDAMPSEAR